MRLVEEAVESIPEQFRDRLANVDFVIEETPRGDEVEGGELLLGLYQGVPLTERGAGYFGVLPDRIVLFRRPIEARARSDADLGPMSADVRWRKIVNSSSTRSPSATAAWYRPMVCPSTSRWV